MAGDLYPSRRLRAQAPEDKVALRDRPPHQPRPAVDWSGDKADPAGARTLDPVGGGSGRAARTW